MAEVRFIQPRDAQGRFAKFNQELRNVLEAEARQYQNEVADYIRTHKIRTEDSTGRLENATRSAGNRQVRATHWRTGIPGYLNKSEAKYWRLIEQGSAGLYARGRGFRGTPLKLRPSGWPGGRPFRSFTGRGGLSRRNGRNANGTVNLRRGSLVAPNTYLVYVKKEIRPMHAYRQVFSDNGWQQRIKRDFEQTVQNSFFR